MRSKNHAFVGGMCLVFDIFDLLPCWYKTSSREFLVEFYSLTEETVKQFL